MGAILATILVAKIDVRARERHAVKPSRDSHVMQEPKNGRELERDGDAAYVSVVGRDDFDFPLGEKRDRLLPGDDP